MAEPIPQADTWGGWFDWTVSTGPSGEFRIEPRRMDAFLVAMPLIFVIWLGFVWLSASNWGMKIAGTVVGAVACAAITVILAWENRRQQRLGPFLTFTGVELVSRNAIRVPLTDLVEVVIDRTRGPGVDGYTNIHHLVLRDAQFRDFTVLSSWSRGGIHKVKQRLEQRLTEAGWKPRPVNLL